MALTQHHLGTLDLVPHGDFGSVLIALRRINLLETTKPARYAIPMDIKPGSYFLLP